MLRVCILLVLLSSVEAAAQPGWTWRNPLPNSFYWRSITTSGDQLFLASDDAWAASEDGFHWQFHPLQVSARFFSLAATPDRLVALASIGTDTLGDPRRSAIFVSTNQSDFTLLSEMQGHYSKIVYGNGRFLAAYYGVITSPDAENWVTVHGGNPFPYQEVDILFGGGKFLFTTASGVSVSEDGVKWTDSSSFPAIELAYHEGVYAAAGSGAVSFSTNALHWETHAVETPSIIAAVALGSSGTLVVGDSLNGSPPEALFSADRTNWVSFVLPFSHRPVDATWHKDRFLIVGADGLLAHSTNGISWTSLPTGPQPGLSTLAFGKGNIVALGWPTSTNSGVWSSNGLAWNAIELPGTRQGLNHAAFGHDKFVAVGDEGHAVFSHDGKAWFSSTGGTARDLFSVTPASEGFVAVGRGVVTRSSNGESWEEVSFPGHVLYDVAFGNDLFIICGSPMWTSPMKSRDLQQWTPMAGPLSWGHEIEFGNGRFVLPTVDGPVYVSEDGTNWIAGERITLSSLQFSDGLFCARGGDWLFPNATAYVSQDGLRWHKMPSLPLPLRVTHNGGRFFAYGGRGSILEAQNFAFLALVQTSGHLRLLPVHTPDSSITIQGSSNLADWADLDSSAEPSLVVPTDSTQNFYRLLLRSP